jgi:hypothetical protein
MSSSAQGMNVSGGHESLLSFKLSSFGISIIALLLMFQNSLQASFSVFGYLDEVLALLSVTYFVFEASSRGKKTLSATRTRMLVFALLLILLFGGLAFNIAFGIQRNGMALIEDIMSCFKFAFIYLGIGLYAELHRNRSDEVLCIITPITKALVLVISFCAFFNLITDIGMTDGLRYGLREYAFLYGTPGQLINQLTYCVVIICLAADADISKRIWFWLGLCCFSLLCTLKTRAFILVGLVILFSYIFVLKRSKKLGMTIFILAAIVLMLGLSQFDYYFLASDSAPRRMFVRGAAEIVQMYMPFGAGLATFGSSAAADFYSPLYDQLGFSARWGMTADNPLFLNDNYLPMIFAQFGAVLGVVFLLFIALVSIDIVRSSSRRRLSSYGRLATYFVIFDMLLSSVQSSYLAHYSVVALLFIYYVSSRTTVNGNSDYGAVRKANYSTQTEKTESVWQ